MPVTVWPASWGRGLRVQGLVVEVRGLGFHRNTKVWV